MTANAREQPLVTLALMVFNQKKYVRDAVEGAFSQTYSPLEIILSDDASRDGSFEELERLASAWKGLHTVRTNRNPENLGIADHVNRLFEMSRGEWVFLAAGDDISMPHRVETLMRHVAAATFPVFAAFSDRLIIDEAGNVRHRTPIDPNRSIERLGLIEVASKRGGIGAGATYAYHRDVWSLFGPMDSRVLAEDRILPLRACILGSILQIPDVLVKYRHGESSLTAVAIDSLTTNLHRSDEFAKAFYSQQHRDLATGLKEGLIDKETFEAAGRAVERSRRFTIARTLSRSPNPIVRSRGLGQLALLLGARSQGIGSREIGRAILGSLFGPFTRLMGK